MAETALGLGLIFWIILMGIGGALYFLPTIIALTQHRRNVLAIALVNIFLGWSFLGWIVALVMAVTKDVQPIQVVHVHQQFVQPPPASPPGSNAPPGTDIAQMPQRRAPGTDLMEQ